MKQNRSRMASGSIRSRYGKKGVTLVEAVIALAIISIVSTTGLSLLSIGLNASRDIAGHFNAKATADNAETCFQFAEDAAEFERAMQLSGIEYDTTEQGVEQATYDASGFNIGYLRADGDKKTITCYDYSNNVIFSHSYSTAEKFNAAKKELDDNGETYSMITANYTATTPKPNKDGTGYRDIHEKRHVVIADYNLYAANEEVTLTVSPSALTIQCETNYDLYYKGGIVGYVDLNENRTDTYYYNESGEQTGKVQFKDEAALKAGLTKILAGEYSFSNYTFHYADYVVTPAMVCGKGMDFSGLILTYYGDATYDTAVFRYRYDSEDAFKAALKSFNEDENLVEYSENVYVYPYTGTATVTASYQNGYALTVKDSKSTANTKDEFETAEALDAALAPYYAYAGVSEKVNIEMVDVPTGETKTVVDGYSYQYRYKQTYYDGVTTSRSYDKNHRGTQKTRWALADVTVGSNAITYVQSNQSENSSGMITKTYTYPFSDKTYYYDSGSHAFSTTKKTYNTSAKLNAALDDMKKKCAKSTSETTAGLIIKENTHEEPVTRKEERLVSKVLTIPLNSQRAAYADNTIGLYDGDQRVVAVKYDTQDEFRAEQLALNSKGYQNAGQTLIFGCVRYLDKIRTDDEKFTITFLDERGGVLFRISYENNEEYQKGVAQLKLPNFEKTEILVETYDYSYQTGKLFWATTHEGTVVLDYNKLTMTITGDDAKYSGGYKTKAELQKAFEDYKNSIKGNDKYNGCPRDDSKTVHELYYRYVLNSKYILSIGKNDKEAPFSIFLLDEEEKIFVQEFADSDSLKDALGEYDGAFYMKIVGTTYVYTYYSADRRYRTVLNIDFLNRTFSAKVYDENGTLIYAQNYTKG